MMMNVDSKWLDMPSRRAGFRHSNAPRDFHIEADRHSHDGSRRCLSASARPTISASRSWRVPP